MVDTGARRRAMVSSDSAYGSSAEDGLTPTSIIYPYDEDLIHKTILVGDSGVGKTSLLVQFDQGKFIPGSFTSTVGIGFTVSPDSFLNVT
ncbi:ras-related protein Rab-26 [Labrus mixtus]|uniref:ras-related protein Rab-26 n=1 Tax=Labrus mixtus TaxID=508554 RepID=UPI0029BFCE90|nr:ras-related protein Rab-26 [Labrus mixtus]